MKYLISYFQTFPRPGPSKAARSLTIERSGWRRCRLEPVRLCLVLGLSARIIGAASFEGRLLDDSTGEPLVARVAVTDGNGKLVEVEGQHSHVQYLDKRWCYVNGSFRLQMPNSGASVEIRRGLETRPEFAAVTNDGTAQPIVRTFRLRRWIDMRREGYVCGDMFMPMRPPPRKPISRCWPRI